jgi:hypothetical protein
MITREDQIRQVLAELDGHIAAVEANVAVLQGLSADSEALEDEGPQVT